MGGGLTPANGAVALVAFGVCSLGGELARATSASFIALFSVLRFLRLANYRLFLLAPSPAQSLAPLSTLLGWDATSCRLGFRRNLS